MKHLLIDIGLFQTRAALVDGDRLTDFAIYRDTDPAQFGDIFLGRVKGFAKGLDAAIIDMGNHEDGFLLGRDIPPPQGTAKDAPINKRVHEGQKLLVQVTKTQRDDKSCQLSAFVSLETSLIALKPASQDIRFARSISNPQKQDALRNLLERAASRANVGLMFRSGAANAHHDQLEKDFKSLLDQWRALEAQQSSDARPRRLSSRPSGAERAFSEYGASANEITSNDITAHRTLGEQDTPAKIQLWSAQESLFDHFHVEEQIEQALETRLPLPSDGNITLEKTEALYVIDVNSGTGKDVQGKQSRALLTNREAALLAVQQMRLRNLGGIILIDCIQMPEKDGSAQLVTLLKKETEADPATVRIVGMTELGLMQITRQRKGTTLPERKNTRFPAPMNKLTIWQVEDMLRDISQHALQQKSARLQLRVSADYEVFVETYGPAIANHLNLHVDWEQDASLTSGQYAFSG